MLLQTVFFFFTLNFERTKAEHRQTKIRNKNKTKNNNSNNNKQRTALDLYYTRFYAKYVSGSQTQN